MPSFVIRADNLSKRYRIGARRFLRETIRERLTSGVRSLRLPGEPRDRGDTLWALRNVSLEVQKGEVVGIIGRNGAGKTTLLKVLSRITAPTEGRAQVWGRLGSLLEVGTGFHPELTGRENIYLSGAILGMKKREIDRKFDEIVSFAEVEKFIDTPVKRYSSGMHVRLGFSVAAHLEPDTLLVDEVLAVGDARFWSKSINKMRALNAQGMTIFLVTHNLWFVQTICTRAICFEQGRILADGNPLAVMSAYRGLSSTLRSADQPLGGKSASATPAKLVLFQTFPQGEWHDGMEAAPDAGFRVVMVAEVDGRTQTRFLLRVASPDGLPYFTVYSKQVTTPRNGRLECEAVIPRLMLMPGEYYLWGAICGPEGDGDVLAEASVPFSIRGRGDENPQYSIFWNSADWRIHEAE